MAAGADRAAARSTFWWSPKSRSLFSSWSLRVCLSGHSTSCTPSNWDTPARTRFLTTMQIPILAGREIDDRDQPGSRPVAVISERLARTYFGNENPVGRRITLPDEKRDLEIVGVSGNLRYGGLKNEEESA